MRLTNPSGSDFDLQEDPRELRSVYHDPAYAGVQRRLTAELHRLQAEVGDIRYFQGQGLDPGQREGCEWAGDLKRRQPRSVAFSDDLEQRFTLTHDAPHQPCCGDNRQPTFALVTGVRCKGSVPAQISAVVEAAEGAQNRTDRSCCNADCQDYARAGDVGPRIAGLGRHPVNDHRPTRCDDYVVGMEVAVTNGAPIW